MGGYRAGAGTNGKRGRDVQRESAHRKGQQGGGGELERPRLGISHCLWLGWWRSHRGRETFGLSVFYSSSHPRRSHQGGRSPPLKTHSALDIPERGHDEKKNVANLAVWGESVAGRRETGVIVSYIRHFLPLCTFIENFLSDHSFSAAGIGTCYCGETSELELQLCGLIDPSAATPISRFDPRRASISLTFASGTDCGGTPPPSPTHDPPFELQRSRFTPPSTRR